MKVANLDAGREYSTSRGLKKAVIVNMTLLSHSWDLYNLSLHSFHITFLRLMNPFQPSVAFYIKTIYRANQVTGFYMKCCTILKLVKYYENLLEA